MTKKWKDPFAQPCHNGLDLPPLFGISGFNDRRSRVKRGMTETNEGVPRERFIIIDLLAF